ncbi:MAG: farnesyl-diphosphate farnesyltransferase [Phycisphaerales bacterium]|nr:farnesyl-diphosphate farnesyltransferase [Phycisphaerales bacterium]MDB5301251.1 farnesyl-diphosphate farnesyltransferase [Phycisphaerales bacterium]MDB5303272.1 farnesyl-diphosphate farnesyltransferase [Phycisphaerales bacterium]
MTMIVSTTDPSAATRSRAYCEQLTRAKARNFYYGLKLLPEPKRSAMFALYAYMRLVDDIADEEDGRSVRQRLNDLEAWRLQTHAVLDGQLPETPHEVWPAFANMVWRHKLPARLFDEVIAGQRQDLEPAPFEAFEPLHEYCYRVAGVVGLASIYVWGFEGGAETEQLAVDLGVAFQLTNILRDLREDAARGRTYLPLGELSAAGIGVEDFRAGAAGKKFMEMMRFQIDRAEAYYRKSRDLPNRISRDCRATLVAMTDIYHGLLAKIADEPERVLRERVSLSLFSKLRIGWRASRTR